MGGNLERGFKWMVESNPMVVDASTTEKAESLFDEISRTAFRLSFKAVLNDPDENRRLRRLRHLAGVAMKKDFSEIVEEKTSPDGNWQVYAKWRIEPERLRVLPANHWSLAVLRELEPREDPYALAEDIRRESWFWLWFGTFTHNHCCTADVRPAIKKACKSKAVAKQKQCFLMARACGRDRRHTSRCRTSSDQTEAGSRAAE
jgi:hypothetical protein